MNPTAAAVVISSLVAGTVSLIVAFSAHIFGAKRDREAEWRKIKLEQYREFTAALSGVVHQGADELAQRRYADAVNNLILIAPHKVLEALYAFQDEISISNKQRSALKYEALFSDLARHMRQDCHPSKPGDGAQFIFRTMDIPRLPT
jgi:hypothetical protein